VVLVVLAAVMASGCGGQGKNEVTVRGKVTLDGNPLTMGLVVVEVEGHPEPRTTSLNQDGTFELTGVPGGTAKVAVRTSHLQGAMAAQAKFAQKAGAKAEKQDLVLVPRKYENTSTSGLVYTIEGGKELHIELKS
jgi:hypothetical protein